MANNIPPGAIYRFNDKGWFTTFVRDADYGINEVSLYDSNGKQLMKMLGNNDHLRAPNFSYQQDRYIAPYFYSDNGDKKLFYSVPLSYVKPTDYFPELTCKQATLLMFTGNKSDAVNSVCPNDIVDTILTSFRENKEKVRTMLNIEYKK